MSALVFVSTKLVSGMFFWEPFANDLTYHKIRITVIIMWKLGFFAGLFPEGLIIGGSFAYQKGVGLDHENSLKQLEMLQ